MGNIISIIRGEGSPYYGDYNDMVYPNLVGKDVEYEYDPNGNLIKNSDNRISLTTYNLLNLPQTVAFSDKSLSVFYYMADGRKIRNATGAYSISTAVPIDSVVKNTDPYISYMSEWNDVYWYQRTQQKYINTPEGNIEVSTGRKMSFSYYYTSKDHLGSIWLYWNSLNNSRANIYYPSGIMREKRRSPYNYGLTGKEIVYDNGLDEYFFGARTLFAPINRFNQPDPLCEEYYHISPYAYCANNFINALDPDGRDWYEYTDKDGNSQTIWRKSQDKTYKDDSGNIWNNIGENYLSINGDNTILFTQHKNSEGELYLSSSSYNLANEKSANTLTSTLGNILSQGSAVAGVLGGYAERSNATFRLTNNKGALDLKFYGNGWKGNQWVTPTSISKIGKGMGSFGKILGFFGTLTSAYQFKQASSLEGKFEHGLDVFMGGIGFVPVAGTGISLYWSFGGKKLHYMYVNKVLIPQIEMGINPGLPTYQPFK